MTIGKNLIEQHYLSECRAASDINQHLPTLYALSNECDSVIEMGTRWIVSTWAFLASSAKSVISIDICHPSEFKHLREYNRYSPSDLEIVEDIARSHNKKYQFIQSDTLKIDIPSTDLLFIDTLHSYYQLSQELALHGNKSNKYIVLHDVELFKYHDEILEKYPHPKTGKTGLQNAIEEFLYSNPHWQIKRWYLNNNGLCVLERISNQ